MDKEKTIRGFKCCMDHESYEDCLDCPYRGQGCRRKNEQDVLNLVEDLQKDLAAALEDLKGECKFCKHFSQSKCSVGGCCTDGREDKWEWRGRKE